MKKKWLVIRGAAGLCAALGWWGLLYPELALTPDTVKIIEEDGSGIHSEETSERGGSLYLDLLNADQGQITFRSRLFTELKELLKKF